MGRAAGAHPVRPAGSASGARSAETAAPRGGESGVPRGGESGGGVPWGGEHGGGGDRGGQMDLVTRRICQIAPKLGPFWNARYSGTTRCGPHFSLYASWVAAG